MPLNTSYLLHCR